MMPRPQCCVCTAVPGVCCNSLGVPSSCTGAVLQCCLPGTCFPSLQVALGCSSSARGWAVQAAMESDCLEGKKNWKTQGIKFLKSSAVKTFCLTIWLKETGFHRSSPSMYVFTVLIYIHSIKRCACLLPQAL